MRVAHWLAACAAASQLACSINRIEPMYADAAAGCYEVEVVGWNREASDVVGFESVPHFIRLDVTWVNVFPDEPPNSATGLRATVPVEWRNPRGRGENLVWWSGNRTGENWITITWKGWSGTLDARLEPDADGYSGRGRVSEWIRSSDPVDLSFPVALRSMSCGRLEGVPLASRPDSRKHLAALSGAVSHVGNSG